MFFTIFYGFFLTISLAVIIVGKFIGDGLIIRIGFPLSMALSLFFTYLYARHEVIKRKKLSAAKFLTGIGFWSTGIGIIGSIINFSIIVENNLSTVTIQSLESIFSESSIILEPFCVGSIVSVLGSQLYLFLDRKLTLTKKLTEDDLRNELTEIRKRLTALEMKV